MTLRRPLPWRQGFAAIDAALAASDRPPTALCSIELRSREPHSFDGFGSFNDDYRDALASRGILFDGGENPVARTNVAPRLHAPADTELYAFAYTVPVVQSVSDPGTPAAGPSFIVSGAGDLRDQADLRPASIVGGDTPWEESGPERTRAVLDEIEARLDGLGQTWVDTDTIVVYTVEALGDVLEPVVLDRVGKEAAGRGLHWQLARPPIEGLLFEMDARGGVDETSLQ